MLLLEQDCVFTTVFCLSFVEQQKRCDPPEWAMIRLVHIVVFLRLLLLYERGSIYEAPKEPRAF